VLSNPSLAVHSHFSTCGRSAPASWHVLLLRCPGSRQASTGCGRAVDTTAMSLPCTSFSEAGVSKPNTRLPCSARRNQGSAWRRTQITCGASAWLQHLSRATSAPPHHGCTASACWREQTRASGMKRSRLSVHTHLVQEGHGAQVRPHALAKQLKQGAQVQVPRRHKVHLFVEA
jgi:hypothetical protein